MSTKAAARKELLKQIEAEAKERQKAIRQRAKARARRAKMIRASKKTARGMWRLVRVYGWRFRRQLAPFVLLATLAGIGVMLQPASAALVLLLATAGAAVVLFWLRGKLPRRQEQAYAIGCLGAVVLWLTLCAWLGPVRWVSVPAVLAWLAGSWAWWSHHRVRPPEQSAAPKAKGAPPVAEIVGLWNANVANHEPLKGATMEPTTAFEHGHEYLVRLVPGKQHLGRVLQELPNIESGLRTPLDRLIFERHPGYPDDPTIVRFRHVTKSPIRATVWFDKPRHRNGKVLLGPHADGMGDAMWRVYQDGMWGGYILGGPGSGKSRMIECIALACMDMGNTVIIYIDGQDGASSATLYKHATWSAGADDSLRTLAALERVAKWRNKENRAHGWSSFKPSPERPGILVIVDEAHNVFPQAPKRWAKAAREWRKLGMAVLGASQHSGLVDVFGGEDPLRSGLLAGNGAGLRVTSKIAEHLIPGLALDLFNLPVLPGYGYLIAAKGTDARTAPMRNRFCPDEQYVADHPQETVPVPTIEEWFSRYTPLELDAPAAKAAGRDYTQRHEIAAQEHQALMDEINGVAPANPLEALAFLAREGVVGPDGWIHASEETTQAALDAQDAEDQRGVSCAELIMGLDWAAGSDGTLKRIQIIEQLRGAQEAAGMSPFEVSTIRKALKSLRDREMLDGDDEGIYWLARRAAA